MAEVIERVIGVSYQPGAGVVHPPSGPELELAATGTPSNRTQRRSHPAVGQAALASLEKRARRQNALIVFEDESGVSLLLSVRATWAPRGHTPVLRHRFNWKRLSLAGALAYEPDGSNAHHVFEPRPGAYNDETLIEFLSELNDLEQCPVLLIWDGLPAHRSRRMSDWVASQRHWLSVEPLPGYAPELNPISSAFSRMRAWVSVRAAAFPFDSSSPNSARSSGVSFTRYSFMAVHFTGTRTPLCNAAWKAL